MGASVVCLVFSLSPESGGAVSVTWPDCRAILSAVAISKAFPYFGVNLMAIKPIEPAVDEAHFISIIA